MAKNVAHHVLSEALAPLVTVSDLVLTVGGHTLTRELSFELVASNISCLVGPSGVGKSTLLRAIARADRAACAEISFPVANGAANRVASMSQGEVLLPWLTVRQNIELPMSLGMQARDGEFVARLLDLVELNELALRYPDELSGGEKQRASLARTLSLDADILLLDEPFSRLDPRLRSTLIERLRRWVSQRGCAALIVSHQLDDVALLADRILELRGFPAFIEAR